MYLLNHNNVDNYPSTLSKWRKKPSKEDFIKVLIDYYEYDDVKSNKIADALVKYGHCAVDDGACNVFDLQML